MISARDSVASGQNGMRTYWDPALLFLTSERTSGRNGWLGLWRKGGKRGAGVKLLEGPGGPQSVSLSPSKPTVGPVASRTGNEQPQHGLLELLTFVFENYKKTNSRFQLNLNNI